MRISLKKSDDIQLSENIRGAAVSKEGDADRLQGHEGTHNY